MLEDCPFQQVNAVRLERLLDYNPFFAQSLTSLYIVLQTMYVYHKCMLAQFDNFKARREYAYDKI